MSTNGPICKTFYAKCVFLPQYVDIIVLYDVAINSMMWRRFICYLLVTSNYFTHHFSLDMLFSVAKYTNHNFLFARKLLVILFLHVRTTNLFEQEAFIVINYGNSFGRTIDASLLLFGSFFVRSFLSKTNKCMKFSNSISCILRKIYHIQFDKSITSHID